MSKRYISIILAVFLMVALTACGASQNQPAQDATQTTAAVAQTQAAAETTAAVSGEETGADETEKTEAATEAAAAKAQAAEPAEAGTAADMASSEALPTWLCPELTTISFLTHSGWSSDAPQPSNDLPKYIELERLTNVHINFEVILTSEFNNIVNVRLASGSDLPDMINYNGSIGRLPEYVEDGLIIDQMKYWETRYPYTHALINGNHPYSDPMYETLYDTMSVNGVFYGATQIVPVKNMQVGLMINKYWLDELGLSMPETVDDFYDTLVAFRDQDATGSGDSSDQIPLVTEKYCLTVIANYFGLEYGGCANGQNITVVDGKLHYERTDDKYRAFVSYLNKLYRDKLLDADFASTDRDALNEYCATNKCGVVNWWIQAMDAFSAFSPYSGDEYNIEEEVFKPIPPLKSQYGGGYLYNRRGGTGSMMLITTSNKNPEVTADWIDFVFASPEGMDIVAYGVLGASYEKDGDVIVPIRDESGNWKRTAVGGGQQPHAYLEANNNYNFALAPEWKIKDWSDLLPYYKEGTVYNLALLPDESEIVTEATADMGIYMDESYTSFILGTADINDDAVWNDYVNTVNQLGLPTYLEYYQKAYERKYGN